MTPLIQLAIKGGARMLGLMPNTIKGLMIASSVLSYTAHARAAVPDGTSVHFVPIVQITEKTTKADIDDCVARGIKDAKVYPKGRTTESHNGVQHYMRILEIVRYAGKVGMRVHFHPEHPSELVENRDAEFLFLPIMDIFINETNTTLVWEHATDATRCTTHWEAWGKTGRFLLTVTAHHLVTNETSTYGDVGAVCKPSYKTEADRLALIELVRKNYSWVMAGGDDAPHPIGSKHRIGPCACGAYTAPFLLQLYAHALLSYVGLITFTNFTSANARRVYGAHIPQEFFSLVEKPFDIPLIYRIGPWNVEPFWAGRALDYSLEETCILN